MYLYSFNSTNLRSDIVSYLQYLLSINCMILAKIGDNNIDMFHGIASWDIYFYRIAFVYNFQSFSLFNYCEELHNHRCFIHISCGFL